MPAQDSYSLRRLRGEGQTVIRCGKIAVMLYPSIPSLNECAYPQLTAVCEALHKQWWPTILVTEFRLSICGIENEWRKGLITKTNRAEYWITKSIHHVCGWKWWAKRRSGPRSWNLRLTAGWRSSSLSDMTSLIDHFRSILASSLCNRHRRRRLYWLYRTAAGSLDDGRLKMRAICCVQEDWKVRIGRYPPPLSFIPSASIR